MPPSICARITSGLMAVPQSIAHTTRSTFGIPFGCSETSAACATIERKDSCSANTRARPLGSLVPQPAFSAHSRNTPACAGWSFSSASR